jgi:ureidoacrylate peracid hydrolase
MSTDAEDLARIYSPAKWPDPDVNRLGLLIIDLQRLCVDPERGMLGKAKEIGREDLVSFYQHRLENLVLPGVAELAKVCREAGIPVIFTRIRSEEADPDARSACHVALGIHVPQDSPDGDIIDVLEVHPDDAVISKTTSDSFVATNLGQVLESLGVEHLAVCGVLTNECVESTVRHAADLHFTVHLLEDGCAALTQEMHDQAVRAMTHAYARKSSLSEIHALATSRGGTL